MRPPFAALMLLFVFGLAKGQSSHVGTHAGNSRVTLELGAVTVWLGMPQTDALLSFQRAGYIVSGDGDSRTVSIGNEPSMIGFKNGKLSYATREWYSQGQDEMAAVVNALTALASYNVAPCTVSHQDMNEPSGTGKFVIVACGERSLMFTRGEARNGQGGTVPVVEVQERIWMQ